ncbi:MAG: Xaa-Pro peptidase family protein [Armatimonadetes bacterium]|nr:Xaa-Pro peptidase family protein [Armatimonadota bacterium]
MNDYQTRVTRLQATMQAQSVALTLLAGTDQMRYLSGWREGGHERFVGLFVPAQGETAFVVPAMNAPQARLTPLGTKQVHGWADESGWHSDAQALFAQFGIGAGAQVLVDDELLSVHLLGLQSLFPNVRFAPAGDLMATLRQVKTAGEIASLDEAARLIDEVFEEVLLELREGVTELEISDCVLAAIKRKGSAPSFSPLICFGANCALPHHHTGNARLQIGDTVIIDIGCLSDNYASDITRTVSFGTPRDPDATKVYETVHRAHWAARNHAKPDVSCESVDSAARSVITAEGYGEAFVHRTGHGIGLSTHEPPYIVSGNALALQEGMCFSVEPGIYLSGRFGVRIENIVTVTADGVRSVNVDASATLRMVNP